MSGIFALIRAHALSALKLGLEKPITYERAFSVTLGNRVLHQAALTEGYYLVWHNTEPYDDGVRQVTAKSFVFIGPFADASSVEALNGLMAEETSLVYKHKD